MASSETGQQEPTVAVVGAGITGLAAAYRLVERARETGRRIQVKLIESAPTLGGTISTEQRDGFLLEHGPDSFITAKPGGLALCRRLDVMDRLIGTREGQGRTYVVRRGKLYALPEGFLLLAPTRFWPLLTSGLFSLPGKLRMGMDLIMPRGGNGASDESLASFVRRRLGQEALTWAAQPLVGGIYTANPETLSLRSTMPRFLDMERTHRSVILAMWRQRKAMTQQRRQRDPVLSSVFVTLKDGLTALVETIAKRLPEGAVCVNTAVENAQWSTQDRVWELTGDGHAPTRAEGVILAVPAYVAGRVVRKEDASLADDLETVEYASSATLNLAYKASDISRDLEGNGFVVPAAERRSILACTFCHRKFAGRAPDGHALLRVFLGGAMAPQQMEREDDEIIRAARNELSELLGIRAEPIFSVLRRYSAAMPQYKVGHVELAARILEKTDRLENLRIAGNALGGVGIPDCADSGRDAADAIFDKLAN